MKSREGVKLTRTSKVSADFFSRMPEFADLQTTFQVDILDLGIEKKSIKFPRQIISPPYKKEKPTSVSHTAKRSS